MAKHIDLKVTELELQVIASMNDDISSMIGTGENEIWSEYVKSMNRMFNRNGYKRIHK